MNASSSVAPCAMQDSACASAQGEGAAFPKRNRELMKYLVSTFAGMLDQKRAAEFLALASELDTAVEQNCTHCANVRADREHGIAAKDPRRNRYLLRLVVGRISHLFLGDKPQFPRSIVDAVDQYLHKALGDVIYAEMNDDADELLYKLNCNDDGEMLRKIRGNREWARFYDTIFIRLVLRFERYPQAKKSFMNVMDRVMLEKSNFTFTDHHFPVLFEALFSDIFRQLGDEDQRLRWDFNFGDGTCKKLDAIGAEALPKKVKIKR